MTIKRIAGIGAVLILVTLAYAGAGAADITSSWSGDTLTFTGNSADTLTQADVAEALQKEGHTTPYNVTISGIGAIGDWSFYGCSGLKSINIPESVTSIGSYAFSLCTNKDFTSITIPEGVTSIGSHAFVSCTYLETISIPSSVTTITGAVFFDCGSLKQINVDSNNQYYKDLDEGVLYSKDGTTIICYPAGRTDTSYSIHDGVTYIYPYAIHACSSLTSITIPESVTHIGSYALSGCSNLESVTIPKNVTSIEGFAFSGCGKLEEIIVDSNNQYYESIDGVLYNKNGTSLIRYPEGKPATSYSITEGVTSIWHSAFDGCNNLIYLNIPASVNSIDTFSFYTCINLKKFTVDPENNYYKDIDGILYNKDGTSLIRYPSGKTDTSYSIPEGVTSIYSCAFTRCTSLTSIDIPDSVTSIGGHVFLSCSNLETISIPNGITVIHEYSFYGCSKLENFSIPDTVTSINQCAFFGCSSLKSINTPNVTNIGYNAFSGCTGLTSINLPMATSISPYAFYGCTNLTSINIPTSATIGVAAFYNCNKINYVQCLTGIPTEDYMDSISNSVNVVWYLVEDPGTTTYDNRYVVSLDGGVLREDYTQTGYSLPSATDITVTNKNFVGWYDDNEYITEHTGDIVAGEMVYAKYDDVKGTDVSLTVGLSYTFTIPASAQLSTVKGNYVYYDVGINAEIREKNYKLVITLNSEPAGTDDEIDYFKVTNTKGDANYQVGKVAQDTFTPIGGLGTHMAIGNELISLDMDAADYVEGYVGFKTITLPSYSGTYTGTLNFLITEAAKNAI